MFSFTTVKLYRTMVLFSFCGFIICFLMKCLIGLCEPCSYLLGSDFLKFSVVSILRVLRMSQRIANNISNKE